MKLDENLVKKKLQALKVELEILSESAAESREPIKLDQQSVGRLSRMDSLQVQAMDLAQETARRRKIKRIDAALVRLKNGDYGYCGKCDENIGAKRLDIDPATPLCIRCAK